MKSNPNFGVTVINHDKPKKISVQDIKPKKAKNKVIPLNYRNVNELQLQALTSLSTYCSQDVGYHCKNAPIFENNEISVMWKSLAGKG